MKTKKQKIANGILVAVMLVLSLFFLFPVIWMIANSFKPDAAITADMNSVSAFIPPAPGKGFFDNYKEILFNTRFLRFMANTLFYAAIMIVAGVIVNGLAGYALAGEHHDADDHSDRNHYHHQLYVRFQNGTAEYRFWLCASDDRQSV